MRLRKRDRQKIKSLNIDKPYTNTIIKKEYNNWYICISIPKEKAPSVRMRPILLLSCGLKIKRLRQQCQRYDQQSFRMNQMSHLEVDGMKLQT